MTTEILPLKRSHSGIFLGLVLGLALGLALLVLLAAAGSGSVHAQGACDRWVLGIDASDSTDCSDETHPCRTVQYAIDQSAPGDVICVADHMLAPGPTVYQEQLQISHTLTLDGKWEAACVNPSDLTCAFTPVACDPARVVLDANGGGRVITIQGNISPTIDCFTITGGDANTLGGDPDGMDAGGGIFSQDAAPIIINNIISGNFGCEWCSTTYGRGGGIYLLNAPATAVISGNLIAHNVADESTWGQGGGLLLRDSNAQVLHNVIEYNRAGHSAGDGGGIAIRGGWPTIAFNDILTNVAGVAVMGNGGGIFAWFTASVTIEDNWLKGNIALNGTSGSGFVSHGGGIYYHGVPSTTAVIRRNRLDENIAGRYDDGQGGGLYLSGLEPTDTIADNDLHMNFAAMDGDGDGGGYYIHNSDGSLSGGLIEVNYGSPGGEGRGGGLFLNDSTLVVSTAVFSSNIAGGINGFGRGGGVFISNTLATLDNNQFIANRAALYPGFWAGSGGAVEMYASPGSVIVNNLFEDNRASVYGGALYIQASDGVSIESNTLRGNNAEQAEGGAAFVLYSDNILFEANTIRANIAQRGGGLYFHDSAATLTNNLLADNELSAGLAAPAAGAAIWIVGDEVHLTHNTLARNKGASGIQVTDYWGGQGVAHLVNTILVSHTLGINVTDGCTATLDATLWGSGVWANGDDWGGAGDISTFRDDWDDPAFVDPASADFHITPASAAMDSGVASAVVTDIDGNARPYGVAPDRGADEIISAFVTPGAGGSLVYTDTQGNPTSIEVPAGAVDQQVVLVYTPVLTTTAAPGLSFAGHAFDLEAFINGVLQPGFVFSLPLEITIHYSDQDVEGMVEETLALLVWDGSLWQEAACGPYDRHPADNWLSAPVCHLSLFSMQGRSTHLVYIPIVMRTPR